MWEITALAGQLARQRVDLYEFNYLWDPMRHCICIDACMLSLAVFQKFKELTLFRPQALTCSVEIRFLSWDLIEILNYEHNVLLPRRIYRRLQKNLD